MANIHIVCTLSASRG